ncbi:MAG: DUF4340 domain-containing protein [Gemmatimonadota bacterium]
MSRTRVYILFGVLAALVLAYAGLRWVRSGVGAGASPDVFRLGILDLERSDSIVMAQRADTVRLARSGRRWRVGRWPADSARIEELWRGFEEADASELVARDAESHARLGVTEAEATHVILYAAGGPRAHLLIGASGSAWSSAYARESGVDEVYLLRGELSSLVRRNADEWRNRRITRFDPIAVDRVVLVEGIDTVVLERADTAWIVVADTTPPAPADSAAVRRAVEGLSRLSSAGFAPDPILDRLDFGNPAARVAVLDADHTTLAELRLVRRGEGTYYVKRPDGPDVWELSELSVGDFLRPADHFRRRAAQR